MLSFDAHTIIKELVADGLKETVAEKLIKAISFSKSSDLDKLPSKEQIFAVEKQLDNVEKHVAAVEKDVDDFKTNFATKADLTALKGELKADMAVIRGEVKADMAAMEARLLKWYITTSITMVAIITGIVGGAFALLFKILGH